MSHAPEIIRLLVVDDHPLMRNGLRLCMETTADIRVIGAAEHALAALHFLRACLTQDSQGQTLPHLVLLDLSMPGMGGLSLIRQLHRDFPRVAVLVLSVSDRTDTIAQAVRAGARGYLLKDEPAQHIIAAVHAVLNGRMVFSAEVQKRLSAAAAVNQRLTPREREVLAYLGRGYGNPRIAQILHISLRTVETHRLNIRRKLHIHGQIGLVKYAIEAARLLTPFPDGADIRQDGHETQPDSKGRGALAVAVRRVSPRINKPSPPRLASSKKDS